MTIQPICTEGFDNYANATAVQQVVAGSAMFNFNATAGHSSLQAGRFGGQSFQIANPGGFGLPAAASSFYWGGAISQWAGVFEATFNDTSKSNKLFSVRLDAGTGRVFLTDYLDAQVSTTAPGVFSSSGSSWIFLEIFLSVGSSGTCTVRINNVQVLTYSGNTRGDPAVGSTVADFFFVGAAAPFFDDMYYGSAGFVGDSREVCIYPTANVSVQWGTSGATNFAAVNSITTQTTNFTFTTTAGLTDKFSMGTVSSTSTIILVSTSIYANKTGGAFSLTPKLVSGGTTTSNSASSLNSGYAPYYSAFANVPGGSGWTTAQVNAINAAYSD